MKMDNCFARFASFAALAALALMPVSSYAQDPNFHIYLCFGQSNMEGQGPIESMDKTVDSRFKVMSTLDCSNLGRTKGTWYKAVPPLCRCYTKLSPSDYFGRTMVANLPDSITVGVVNVAISGCDIRLFSKLIYASYDSTYTESWFQDAIKQYNGNPYQYLVEMAKLAQKDGVIKGILLHQGETNTGDAQWPSYVNTIYNDLLTDLSLTADAVPILAGEVVSAAQNGCCSSMNTIIRQLPATIHSAHVISSAGCTDLPDNAHFTSDGYRILGRRYAVEMLSLMGYKAVYAEAECATVGSDWQIKADAAASNGSYASPALGKEYLSAAPADDAGVIKINFTVSADTTYYLYGRFNNMEANVSYWVKIDGGSYELKEISAVKGWQWLAIKTCTLAAGEHTVSIALATQGLSFDKATVKNSQIAPVSIGEEALIACKPLITTGGVDLFPSVEGYALDHNIPNPFTGSTEISFVLPQACSVSLKVFSAQGAEIAELAGRTFSAGKHSVQCKLDNLSAGNYYYTINADGFSATRNMIVAR